MDALHSMAESMLKSWADKGRIVEGGWQAMILVAGLQGCSDVQLAEMRKAFMMGAQHLFTSLMVILDPGSQPTKRDLRRMESIHNELEAFRKSLGE